MDSISAQARFFTKVLYTADPPEAWAQATVVEIFKGKGSHTDPEMYRPISLLNTAYKLFARLLQIRISEAMDRKLRETQFGFRKGRSCIQPLYILHRLQEYALDKKGPFYMLFLDWEKAFDKISHPSLHSALVSFGLDPMYIRMIDALYEKPQFTVAAGGKSSSV